MKENLKTILYIEDDRASLTLVRRLLESYGYKLIEASNAKEGITKAEVYKPDLILMDINIPGMNGYELTTKLKSIYALSSIPIVALTSLSGDGEREMAIMAGCDGFISKPIDIEKFPNLVAQYLSGRRDDVEADKKSNYLREYSRRLVTRLEGKIDELSKAEKEWEDTFNAIADMVSIHDRNGKIIKANISFYNRVGISPDKVIGQMCNKVFYNYNGMYDDFPCDRTIRSLKPVSVEVQNPHLGGVFLIRTYPIFDEKGEFMGFVHVAIDITEKKEMEEQVLQLEKLSEVGELVSSLAHELNNPITGILGYIEHLMDLDKSEDIEKGLKVIQGEAERSARIIRSLLDFSRKHSHEKVNVAVNNVIETVLTLKGHQMRNDSIKIIRDFKEPSPIVNGDFNQLQQVVLNIINNSHYAMCHHKQKGILTIKTLEDGASVLFIIEDDGMGIRKEDMKKIFEKFFTTKEVGKGTGLGLSISKKIITEHGGTIEVESEFEKGSRFIVKLPKA
ncbi:MAG: response regulator [Nitrospinae bacterium]|nr:response regulator [Nitrospinota bacterium]